MLCYPLSDMVIVPPLFVPSTPNLPPTRLRSSVRPNHRRCCSNAPSASPPSANTPMSSPTRTRHSSNAFRLIFLNCLVLPWVICALVSGRQHAQNTHFVSVYRFSSKHSRACTHAYMHPLIHSLIMHTRMSLPPSLALSLLSLSLSALSLSLLSLSLLSLSLLSLCSLSALSLLSLFRSRSGAVIKAQKNNMRAYLLRGRAYYAMGEPDVAVRHYKEALRLDPVPYYMPSTTFSPSLTLSV
jgi:hypothetical protein